MNYNIILGAGFSIDAKYPSGHTLNQKFFNEIENKILRQSSSEWIWDEYDEATAHNGRLNDDHLNISYLLSELVESYQREKHVVFDYEEFYDWFKSKESDQEFIKTHCQNVNKRLEKEFNISDDSSHYFKDPDINQYNMVDQCFNYLIADILNRPYERESKQDLYSSFIKIIKESTSANIFTLNHDLLCEYYLQQDGIKYSDGFSKNDSSLLGNENQKLQVFSNDYKEKINLYKLHGSVDYLRFNEALQKGNTLNLTGNYYFFKADTNYDKHYVKRVDNLGQCVQSNNNSIVPQFLTGKTKLGTMKSHLIYKEMYESFKNSFDKIDSLIIIGYSYRDTHVNEIIKNAIDNYSFKIININPYTEFPFRRLYKKDGITELKSLNELN